MKTLEKNKNVEKVGEIKLTNDLEQFNFMNTNRPIDPKHVDNIRKSVRENGPLINPIMVNENNDIIDGQNRLVAFRKEQQPIYYYTVNGYGINEVRILNIKQRNWVNYDYLKSYVEMGYEDYILLDRFHKRNNEFSLTTCISLLSKTTSTSKFSEAKAKIRKSNENSMSFNRGTWKIKDMEWAVDMVGKLRLVGQFYEGYYKSNFISTIISLMNNSKFEFDEFIHKLKIQPTALVDCSNRNQYKALIEKIYNHRRRDKVNLRY